MLSDVIIEADGITILQGEKAKDYNVRLTKTDGSPLGGLPLTIAFYNKDYSFSKEVTTNEFGIASLPLYLTGDSWKVDVHFKGNEQYKPNLTTKDITIQKFGRLMTYIDSKNYHINEDEVITTGTGYYTIYLKDENDFPIANEPVSFKIVSSKQNIEDVTFILNTGDNGAIIVPYLTHNDTVSINAEYKGCTRYSPSLKNDIVSFDDIADRTEISFRTNNAYLEIRKGNGAWEDIWTSSEKNNIRCIVNYENDNRTVHDGIEYYYAMNSNDYKVTLSYKGNDHYFSKATTLTYNKPNDSRVTLLRWIELQDPEAFLDDEVTLSSQEQGHLNHITLKLNFEMPFETVYMGFKKGAFNGTYDFEVKGLPRYVEEDGKTKTIVEYDIVNPISEEDYSCFVGFWIKNNDYIKNFVDQDSDVTLTSCDYDMTTDLQNEATLSLVGLGYQNNAYQKLEIMANNNSAISYDKVNEYVLLQFINNDTFEEFYTYSYLVDNVTPSLVDFVLGLGHWTVNVVSKEYGDYGGDFYQANVIIDNEALIENIDDFFFEMGNWNNVGMERIIIQNNMIIAVESNTLISYTDEFTSSSRYSLYFNVEHASGSSNIIVGLDAPFRNGLYIRNGLLSLFKNGRESDRKSIESDITGSWRVTRDGNDWEIYHRGNIVYRTDELRDNRFGLYNGETIIGGLFVEDTPTAGITPSTSDYDGTVYGSDLHLEVMKDHINLYDYGMLPSGAVGSAKVIVDDVPITADQLSLELEIKYNNNRYERLDTLKGEMQIRAYEDIATSDATIDYSQILCSPMVVPNVETVFTRHSEEGLLYYIKDPFTNPNLKDKPTYYCNAYTQYKGGCEIKTETGIYLFNLDNAYSPVYVGNSLVRAEFHRRSGFIKISRWDENSNSWASVNVLKLQDTPQLSLSYYDDDYCEIKFGATTWKFFRGRPFIIVNHEKDDLRILNLVDRVYCEILDNQRVMGFLEEKDAINGIFNPQLSIQQFKQELHIGQNIRLDNFEIYDINNHNEVVDVSEDSTIALNQIDGENAVQINKNTTDKVGLNFPSYSNYVKRVDEDFSLLIGKVVTTESADTTMNITVKARGFDERGAIPVENSNCQYGIWEQTQTVEVDTTQTDEVRVSFTKCPASVKYIDFIVILEANDDIQVKMKDFMYYEGADIEINYEEDTSKVSAEQTEITFKETYFANLYNEDDTYGLSIIRPTKEKISLRRIYASEETVLIPYMKKATYWDKPQQVFLEYLNAKRQRIDIEREN